MYAVNLCRYLSEPSTAFAFVVDSQQDIAKKQAKNNAALISDGGACEGGSVCILCTWLITWGTRGNLVRRVQLDKMVPSLNQPYWISKYGFVCLVSRRILYLIPVIWIFFLSFWPWQARTSYRCVISVSDTIAQCLLVVSQHTRTVLFYWCPLSWSSE